MAAVLACGPGAALSHRSAAALLGLVEEEVRPIEVSVPRPAPTRVPGIVAHRRGALRDRDLGRLDGIPVTAPARTLVDLAAIHDSDAIERLVNDADRLDLIDPEALRSVLGEFRGQRGVARLRAVLDRRTLRLTRSGLERRFLRLVQAEGLPLPQTGAFLNGYEVDFHWPELGLVVETDGLRYHRTPYQQARDRERDQAHTAAGLTQLRFTHAQVFDDPAAVGETLARVVRRLRGGGA